eukprot:scaffold14_cov130-Cylindrotheca_fusiformis.AAC.11
MKFIGGTLSDISDLFANWYFSCTNSTAFLAVGLGNVEGTRQEGAIGVAQEGTITSFHHLHSSRNSDH